MRRSPNRKSLPTTSPASFMGAKNDVWVALTSSLSQNVISWRSSFLPASTLRLEYLPLTTSTGAESVPGCDFHVSPIRAQTVKPVAVTGCPFTVTSPLKVTSLKPGGVIAWASAGRLSLSTIAAADARTSANSATPSMSQELLERFAPLLAVEVAFECSLTPKPESVCISKPCGSMKCWVRFLIRRTVRVHQLRRLRIARWRAALFNGLK